MKIKKINYSTYKNHLKQTFINSKSKYSYQEGVMIELIILNSSKPFTGYGEASILAGFSMESIQEINWGIESFIAAIDFNYNYSLEELLDLAEIQCFELPALHFAIDTALYDLAGKLQNLPISKLLNKNSADLVEFSDIYISNNKINSKQHHIIKYKLGVNKINDDIQIINHLSDNNPKVQFRFDGNQLYTEIEFLKVVKELQHINIDYFEEPLINLNSSILKKMKNEINTKIAIDESLYNGNNYLNWIENNLIDSVIIKPSIFGGYKKSLELYNLCKTQNINVVLSSALENSVGNMSAIHLAAAINNNFLHGLNIHNFFENFIYPVPYSKNESYVSVNKFIGLGI